MYVSWVIMLNLQNNQMFNPVYPPQDIGNELLHRSFLDQRKKEMLYKKWSERIFQPIQAQIYHAMKGNYAEVDKKKREMFNAYIRHRNRKVSARIKEAGDVQCLYQT